MKKFGMGAVGAVVVGVAVWFGVSTLDSRAERTRVEGAQNAKRSRYDARSHTCAFEIGHRLSIAGTTQTKVEFDLGPLAQAMTAGGTSPQAGVKSTQAERYSVIHKWHLEAVVVEVGDSSSVLAARLSPVQVDYPEEVPEQRDPLGEIDAPFLIRLDRRCGLSEFAWRRDADLVGARNQQSLVAGLNFLVPPTPTTQRYDAESFDVTGRYRATYRASETRLDARILGYAQVWADKGQKAPSKTRVDSSGIHVIPGPNRWFDSLLVEQSNRFYLGKTKVGTLELSTKAKATSPAKPVGDVAAPSDSGWQWGLLLEKSAEQVARDNQGRKVEAMAVEDALKLAESLIGQRGLTPADYTLFLRDWLRANPQALDELLALIKRGELSGKHKLRAALFAALGTANTPETRAALMSIFRDDAFAYGYQLDAAHALSVSANPVPDGFLDELIGRASRGPKGLERASMQLTVGMFASAQAKNNPEQAALARATAQQWLEAAKDGSKESAIHALQTAGNAAHDDLAEPIGEYLDHEDPTVRRHAADSLRNSSSEKAMPMYEEHYADESDPGVRGAILAAAEENAMANNTQAPPAMVSMVASQMKSTASDAEFARMAHFLGRSAKNGDTRARQALQEAFETEKASDDRSIERLEALGAHIGNKWKAK